MYRPVARGTLAHREANATFALLLKKTAIPLRRTFAPHTVRRTRDKRDRPPSIVLLANRQAARRLKLHTRNYFLPAVELDWRKKSRKWQKITGATAGFE
jgi:hypothetical protein